MSIISSIKNFVVFAFAAFIVAVVFVQSGPSNYDLFYWVAGIFGSIIVLTIVISPILESDIMLKIAYFSKPVLACGALVGIAYAIF